MSNAVGASGRGRRNVDNSIAPTVWAQWQFVIVGGGVLILAATFFFGCIYATRQYQAIKKEAEAAHQPAVTTTSEAKLPPSTSSVSEVSTNQLLQYPLTEEAIASRARLLRLQEKITEMREEISSIRETIKQRYDVILELYKSEAGRRIASNKENVATFAALQSTATPSRSVIDSLETRLDTLAKPIATAINGESPPFSTTSPELSVEIDKLLAEIRELDYETATNYGLFRKLEQFCADDPAADKTLSEALSVMQRESDAKIFAKLRATQEAAKQEADVFIMAAEKEAVIARGRAEAEARKILGDAEAAAIREEIRRRDESFRTEVYRKH